jgi:glycosyltransferase involved in cell wall biosynthesis
MNNLHLVMNDFRHPSRVLKQVDSVSALTDVGHVYVGSLCGDDQATDEVISKKASIKRFYLRTRWLPKGPLVQVAKYLEFTMRVFLFYRFKDISLVNVHHFALLPLGYLMKLSCGAKLIYDAHELETEQEGILGIRKKFAKILERIFIKKADHVFVVSESIADWYQENYAIIRPTVVMNAPRFIMVKRNNYFREHFSLRPDQKIALYQGGLSPGRGIEEIVAAFSDRTDDSVVIIFMGYGSLEDQIISEANRSGNIYFHPAVSPNELLKYTGSADFGMCLIQNTCKSYFYCMPNKLFEYLMTGLPVLVSNMKEMGEFVEKYEVGHVLKDFGVSAINRAVDEILAADLALFQKNARIASMEHSWELQEAKMIADYQILLSKIN